MRVVQYVAKRQCCWISAWQMRTVLFLFSILKELQKETIKMYHGKDMLDDKRNEHSVKLAINKLSDRNGIHITSII